MGGSSHNEHVLLYRYVNMKAIHAKAVLVEAINKHSSENTSTNIWQ
jgi:hypothetical protein